jgi:hypothetical protein
MCELTRGRAKHGNKGRSEYDNSRAKHGNKGRWRHGSELAGVSSPFIILKKTEAALVRARPGPIVG